MSNLLYVSAMNDSSIHEWQSDCSYKAGAIIIYHMNIYKSRIDNNLGNCPSGSSKWLLLI